MMEMMCVEFESKSENEAFARVVAAAFITRLNPTLDEVEDVKMAISEAVTNAIVHGYENDSSKKIFMRCSIENQTCQFRIMDQGVGIADIERAKEPMYSTKKDEERAGMGFTFMDTLMDDLQIYSQLGEGTTIIMTKTFSRG